MNEFLAIGTAKEAKSSVRAAGPEEGVLLVQARRQPERGSVRRHGAGCYSQRARQYASSTMESSEAPSQTVSSQPVSPQHASQQPVSPRAATSPQTSASSGHLLDGRRILVVGASSGIGRALAVQATHWGATVALAARRLDLLEAAVAESSPDSARAFRCDVADESEAARTVDEATAWMGGLDVVVYAAGNAPLGRLSELESSDWHRLLATNLIGAAVVISRALPTLRSAENGTVALLSSHTVGSPWPSLSAYAASKAALEELARGLRVEEPKVRVLRVRVGDTATSFADGWDPTRFNSALEGWVEQGLLRYRIMSADEVAERVLRAVADVDGPAEILVRGEETSSL
jgi:NAD(P)-dependent dehydrogenase (short-subunit alcohol dehydrogenase family)